MAATWNKFNSFMQAVAEKKHNLSTDVITVALTAAANAPVATNTVLANLTEIAYTNLSSRTVTNVGANFNTSGYKVTLTDLILSASGGAVATFRYIALYNNTATNDELIAWFDYGGNVTLADGENLTLDFAADTLTFG